MKMYWELKKQISNADNQKVINEFLLSMKNTNRSESTIIKYRSILQSFFKKIEIPFSSLTPIDIQEWFKKHQNKWNKRTIRTKSIALRSFYHYCVERGYVKETPIKNQKKLIGKYWEINIHLPNRENQRVINKYLLSMKVANLSFHTINNFRYFLQIFF